MGVIVDGAVRDCVRMREVAFPVFARDTILYDSRDRQRVIDVEVRVEVGGVRSSPGDWVLADDDGVVVVVVPQAIEAAVLQGAWEKVHAENAVRDAIRQGMKATEALERFGVLYLTGLVAFTLLLRFLEL